MSLMNQARVAAVDSWPYDNSKGVVSAGLEGGGVGRGVGLLRGGGREAPRAWLGRELGRGGVGCFFRAVRISRWRTRSIAHALRSSPSVSVAVVVRRWYGSLVSAIRVSRTPKYLHRQLPSSLNKATYNLGLKQGLGGVISATSTLPGPPPRPIRHHRRPELYLQHQFPEQHGHQAPQRHRIPF